MENEYNAVITVSGEHWSDGETDSSELITEGNFYKKGNKFFITYKEDGSMGNSFSYIKTDGSAVYIKRRGDYSSEMIYTCGKRHSFVYHMPYGDMAMDIVTEKADVSLGESGGHILLEYLLENGGDIQKNTVKISVRTL